MANERKFDIEVALQTRIDACKLSLDRVCRELSAAREDGDIADIRFFQGQLAYLSIMAEEFEYLLLRVKEG